MIRCSEHGRQGLWDSIEAASHAGTFVVLLFLTMPPLCYTYIFRPCMDCYDFEAAVAHEIGHILGFHHPDVHPERNWNATVPMSRRSARTAGRRPSSPASTSPARSRPIRS